MCAFCFGHESDELRVVKTARHQLFADDQARGPSQAEGTGLTQIPGECCTVFLLVQ